MTEGWIQGQMESWDRENIFFRIWNPANAQATMMIIHGFGEHSGRYEKFVQKMPELPVRFGIMDLRGMGRSGGERVTVRSFEDYVRDLTFFERYLREHYGIQTPVILMGHSLGGLVAVAWAIQNPGRIKAMILTSPFLGLKGLSFLNFLNQVVMSVCPGFMYHHPVIPRHLTHDQEEVAKYKTDPLIQRKISARLVREIIKQIVSLRQRPLQFPFPVSILAAGEEKIVDLNAIRRFFNDLQAPEKEYKEFAGFYHEIFHEAGQQEVFNVLRTIIEDCV